MCQAGSAVADASLLIRFAELHLGDVVGRGVFGTVTKAVWRGVPVAVKTLNAQALNMAAANDFISEARLMSKLLSPRVLQLLGVCVPPDPLCLVTELMSRGCLSTTL